jgi:hypothetical protein
MKSGIDASGFVWDWVAYRSMDRKLRPKIEEALLWLSTNGTEVVQARTHLNNLAHGYFSALAARDHGGTWTEAERELSALATASSQLAAAIKGLGFTAQIVMTKEIPDEARKAADIDQLFQTYLPLGEILRDQTIRVMKSSTAGPTSGHPSSAFEMKIEGEAQWVKLCKAGWIARTEALAELAREGAQIAKAKGRRGGRKKSSVDYYGSPALQLMTDCARWLVSHGLDPAKTFPLAKVVHHLVDGKAAPKKWADEDRRLFNAWWRKVKNWIGRPETPEQMGLLIEKGPHGMPRRRREAETLNRLD